MLTSEQAKENMDNAIATYISLCTGIPDSDVDYSFINQDIDDAIEMLGGKPVEL